MSEETTENNKQNNPEVKKLYRIPKSGKVAGVCAGLAEYFEIDVTLLRIIFIILTLASGGFGLLAYLILAIVMPVHDASGKVHPAGKDISDNITHLATEIRDGGGVTRLRNYFGIALVIFGAWLLLIQFFPMWISLNWNYIWPAALILLGLVLITRARR